MPGHMADENDRRGARGRCRGGIGSSGSGQRARGLEGQLQPRGKSVFIARIPCKLGRAASTYANRRGSSPARQAAVKNVETVLVLVKTNLKVHKPATCS